MKSFLLQFLIYASCLAAGSGATDSKTHCELTSRQFFESVKAAGKCKRVSDCVYRKLLNGASVCAHKKSSVSGLISKQKKMIAACAGVMEVGLPVCSGGVMVCDSIFGCFSGEH